MSKKDIVIHFEWLDDFEEAELSENNQMELIFAAIQYARKGIEPEFDDKLFRLAWTRMRRRIDDDIAKYFDRCEINRENGKKGGAPKGNQNAVKTTEKQPKQAKQPKQPDTESESDTDTDSDSDSESPLDILNNYKGARSERKNDCPSTQEVKKLFSDRGYVSDPDVFYAHYAAKGWELSGDPVHDWVKLAELWEAREKSWKAKGRPPEKKIKNSAHREYDYAALDTALFG